VTFRVPEFMQPVTAEEVWRLIFALVSGVQAAGCRPVSL
jgi:hypothetical protein